MNNEDANGFYSRMHNRFLDSMELKLVMIKTVPAGFRKKEPIKKTLIYVLGGNQDSLTSRFRKAAELYHQGLSRNILVLSRPGITEFSQELGRNLTNNEWAVRELEKYDVRKEDVEAVSVGGNLFGTLREGKFITEIVRNQGCDRLILVTSGSHTRRVFNTFSAYASGRPLEIFIYGSDSPGGLRNILAEYVKLILYDNFLIPLYSN